MGRHRRDRVEFDFSWLLPSRFEWRWALSAALLGVLGLYEASTWRSCSSDIEYRYYKDLKLTEHPACTYEAETFRHRPVFARECEEALRSTNADILHDNKFKCWWGSQPLSLGKWETVALLAASGYMAMRMYLDYHRRLEERRIQTKESRRALEFIHSEATAFPRFGLPEELFLTKRRDARSPVRIEPVDY